MSSAVKVPAFAGLVRVFMLDLQQLRRRLAADRLRAGRALAGGRCGGRRRPDQREAHAGVLVDQPRRVHPRGGRGVHRRRHPAMLFYWPRTRSWSPAPSRSQPSSAAPATAAISSSDYRGLARTNPLLAGSCFTVLLLAQAGVPFTPGFFAKFYVIIAAVDAGSWPLGHRRHGLGGRRRVPLPAPHRLHVHVRARRPGGRARRSPAVVPYR